MTTREKLGKAPQVWYRGEGARFLPEQKHLAASKNPIKEFYLDGWLPEGPFITKNTTVLTIGSCFARHIRRYMLKLGIKQYHVKPAHKRIPIVHASAGLNTTFAVRQQFEWAWEDRTFDEALWFDGEKNKVEALEEYREETKRAFNQTDVFIITLGLSEVWYNKKTGDVFWRGIPVTQHDPELHGFRVSTVQENVDNLNEIIVLGKKHKPGAKFIFTLSPVPLAATFRPISCITANSVSKAILRVAVDEIMNQHKDNGVYYWPSYEMIRETPEWAYRADNRHVKPGIIDNMMTRFARYYIDLKS